MEFRGSNYFLSNSFQFPFDYEIEGTTYRFQNAESAFQAERAPSRAADFVGLTAKEAKDLGKKMKKKEVRPNFTEIRLFLMEKVLEAKFSSPSLFARLWAIEEPITMDVNYPDRYWGLYEGRGQNHMGKCLSNVRERIAEKKGLLVSKEATVCCYKIQKGGMVTFDTETTGVSPKYDDILQITIAGQNGEILLSTYVKPQSCTSWSEAEEIHQITPDMVKDAPTADKVAAVVKQIFDNADFIVGHNVPFDMRMVEARFGYSFEGKQILDTLPYVKQYVKEYYPEKVFEDGSPISAKLKDAVRIFLGEKEYNAFLQEAHDAEADTLETAKVAKQLAEIYHIDIPMPKSMGVENLFGIEDGVLCNQVNSKGVVIEGFTKRLFYHHPEAKKAFNKAYTDCVRKNIDPLGQYTIVPCLEKPGVSIANIYAQKDAGNAEIDGRTYTDVATLCTCISKICDERPDKPVYLPCIMSSDKGEFRVVDAIGCGKSGGKWEEIGKGLLDLHKDNLFLVDTTTGRCVPLKEDKNLEQFLKSEELSNESDDIEIC